MVSRRLLLLGTASAPLLKIGCSNGAWADTVGDLEQLVRQRESALRVAERRHAAGRIPYRNVQDRERELAEARTMLAQAEGGGGGSSGGQPSQSQSTASTASTADIRDLEQLVQQRESALRVARRRHAAGRIPYRNVQDRERELAEARAMLAQAKGGGGGTTQQAEKPAPTESQPTDTGTSANGPTITVRNGSELQQAINNAGPGRRIMLAAGNYNGTFVIDANGRSNAPIAITGNPSNVTLLSTLTIHGDHVHVQGISFRNASLVVRGNNCRAIGNRFLQSAGLSLKGAANASVAYNEFDGWSGRYALEIDPFNSGRGRNPHIRYNLFFNSNKIPITVGLQPSHSRIPVGALIERNLFVRCGHSQIINVKSSQNRVRQNTLMGGGAFLVRHGADNSFIENWLEDCDGLWLSDKNCQANGNRLMRSNLLVLAGDITPAQTTSQVGGHPRAEGTRLANNEARTLRIGVSWGWNLPALDTIVESHRGSVKREREQNSQIRSTGSGNGGSAAPRLQRSQVGLAAL